MSNPTATHSSSSHDSLLVGGVRIDLINLDEATALLVGQRHVGAVHLCNAYTISLAAHDPGFRSHLNAGSLNLIDGKPLAWVARLRGFRRLTERPCGPDLMQAVLSHGRSTNTRHFLFGSTPEVLSSMRLEIERRWPGVELVGSLSPPFRELSDQEAKDMASEFGAAGAHIVWVGLGTPKQDLEVQRLAALLPGTYVAIGAAFDFIAGTKARAPQWVRQLGLEWAFRLLSEPRRLWRRYLFGNARFLWVVVHDAMLRMTSRTNARG